MLFHWFKFLFMCEISKQFTIDTVKQTWYIHKIKLVALPVSSAVNGKTVCNSLLLSGFRLHWK